MQQTPLLTSGDARDDRAPAVEQGMPFGDSSNLALSEDRTTVTPNELPQSRRRRDTLETTEAQITHEGGWGAVLAAVQANGVAIQANGVAIQAMQINMQAMQVNMQAMQANMQNLRRREKIRSGTWTPILVERQGANPMGNVPHNYPQSRADVFVMQAAQIDALEAALNLPPGYFHGAQIGARLEAVLEYLYEG